MSPKWILLALVAVLAFASIANADASASDAASAKEVSASESAGKNGKVVSEEASEKKAEVVAEVIDKKTEESADVIATKPPRLRSRSIMQACRKEFLRLCSDRKDAVKCLAASKDKVEDTTCKTWLDARESCLDAVKKSKQCDEKESPRACLRRLDRALLPDQCSESDFYRSVKMFGMFRRRGVSGKVDKLLHKGKAGDEKSV